MTGPTFLSLPTRGAKPRRVGLTHVIDTGITARATEEHLAHVGAHVDIWKPGWGTAYLDTDLGAKLALLHRHAVSSCLGGTLLEVAWGQGAAGECLAWARDVGFTHVEVSCGTVPMTAAEKHDLVRRAARSFTVLTEVGAKDPQRRQTPAQWRAEAGADLDAGAALVVAEGRQSGTVGIYDAAGGVREDVVEALLAGGGVDRVLFEAPRAHQQAWFVRRVGADVNLGNIAVDDVLGTETLRLGLRSDTAATVLPTHLTDPDAETGPGAEAVGQRCP